MAERVSHSITLRKIAQAVKSTHPASHEFCVSDNWLLLPSISHLPLIWDLVANRVPNVTPNILFVDDEAPIREMLSLYFSKKGYSVTTATCGRDAKALAAQGPFNLVILDMNLAGESGLDLLRFFKSNYPSPPVVIFTGMAADQGLLEKALTGGACGFMSKTEPLDKLFAEVNRHLLKAPAA